MRKRLRPPIVPLLVLVLVSAVAMMSRSAEAMGNRTDGFVNLTLTSGSTGIVTSFTATGSLGGARNDPSGGDQEQIGCWTLDGEIIVCQVVDRNGAQAMCSVADHDSTGRSLGYLARLAMVNGDSYVSFDAVAVFGSGPIPAFYTCTAFRVENRSIYPPKAK